MENKNIENQNSLITKATPQIAAFFESIDRMLDKVEILAKKSRPTLNGDSYLTDKELSERLKISRRALTLQERGQDTLLSNRDKSFI